MSDGQNVEHLIEEARKLPAEDYNRLIIELLRESKKPQGLLKALKQCQPELPFALADVNPDDAPLGMADKHRITELRGLGKEIWQMEDAQDYVNAERESWND